MQRPDQQLVHTFSIAGVPVKLAPRLVPPPGSPSAYADNTNESARSHGAACLLSPNLAHLLRQRTCPARPSASAVS
eukprot:5896806-Pleurochrysis_carterae.AAC.1